MSEIAVAKKPGTIPRGVYDAVIRDVSVLRRKEDRSHVLRVIVRTLHLDRDLLVWQPLADGDCEDPFDLTETQRRSLERFAVRLGAMAGMGLVPQSVPRALIQMREDGVVVQAKVSQTKVGQRVTLTASKPEVLAAGPIAQQVIEHTEQAAAEAHAAHEKVLQGLSAARLGLTVAAQGCYELGQSEGWRALGFDSLSEYLAAPEVTLSRSEFYRLAAIWQAYVLEGGADPTLLRGAAESKLEVPLPALGKGLVTVEQAIEDATSLPRADLRIKYAGLVDGEEAEQEAERKESRRRDVEVTDEMVDRGARALFDYVGDGWDWDGPGGLDRANRHRSTELAQVVLRAALGRAS